MTNESQGKICDEYKQDTEQKDHCYHDPLDPFSVENPKRVNNITRAISIWASLVA